MSPVLKTEQVYLFSATSFLSSDKVTQKKTHILPPAARCGAGEMVTLRLTQINSKDMSSDGKKKQRHL